MNKARRDDGIPAELFQILKDDDVKVHHEISQQIGNLSRGHKTGQRSDFISLPKKGNAKECSNYYTISLISHTSKVMFKILQPRLQQYMSEELPDIQAGFRKGKEPEVKLPISVGS